MFKKTKTTMLILALTCSFVWAQGKAKTMPATSTEPLKTTADDRQSVEVTVYNSGSRGLIKELRKVTLPPGRGELQFMDVAAKIMPTTVHIKPLANVEDFVILEQNYEYDLISHSKLMDKYVGKNIKIVDYNEYKDSRIVIDATLMSKNGADEVFKIDNSIYLGHPGIRVVPEIPGNLISRPTLSWIFRNRTAREYQLEVTYMTGFMDWNADYVLMYDEGDEARSGLSGWVTLENQSGASYDDAKMTLVAGSTKDGMYVYDLPHPTTIKHNQTKQVSLMEAHGMTVEKEYLIVPAAARWREKVDGATKLPVMTFFRFKNTKDNKLGDPLPAGKIMVYTADNDGRRQFIGEDRVAHIPREEEVRLKIGEAFDIVAERTQVNYNRRSDRSAETEWKIAIRNRKSSEDVTVRIDENASFARSWEIRESTHKHTKIDARTFRFEVPVAKGQEVVINYKIRTDW